MRPRRPIRAVYNAPEKQPQRADWAFAHPARCKAPYRAKMPRRVIYIKNPSSGSNFRTIGGSGSAPRPPRSPRPSGSSSSNGGGQTNSGGQSNPDYGVGAVGYAGNFTAGAPDYSNWYTNLPNTTQVITNSQPWSLIPTPEDDALDAEWDYYYDHRFDFLPGMGNRELTTAEYIAALVFLALITGGASLLFEGSGASAAISIAGTQGGALAQASLLLGGLPVSINSAPFVDSRGQIHYSDLVSYIQYHHQEMPPPGSN